MFHYAASEAHKPTTFKLGTGIPQTPGTVRIVCISDTHLKEEECTVPPCDVLLHAGDILFRSGTSMSVGASKEAYTKFCAWLARQPCSRGVLICGNHDMRLKELGRAYIEQHLPHNFVYLENEAVDIRGIKIFGSPNSVGSSPNSAWQEGSSKGLWRGIDAFNDDNPVDIVMSHGPAHYFAKGREGGDERQARRLVRSGARLHVSGHLHWAYGMSVLSLGSKKIPCVCCCIMDGSYEATNHPYMMDMRPRKGVEVPLPMPVGLPVAGSVQPAHQPLKAIDQHIMILMFHNRRPNHLATLDAVHRELVKHAKCYVLRTQEEAESLLRSPAAQKMTGVVGIGDRTVQVLRAMPAKNRDGHIIAKALCSGAYLDVYKRVLAAGIHLVTYSEKASEGAADILNFMKASRPSRSSNRVRKMKVEQGYTVQSHPGVIATR